MKLYEIQEALRELGGKANKRLGQHFLLDKRVLDRIIDISDLHKGDHVLEIGPGLGVLTRRLLEAGAKVTAIEKDQRFVDYLNKHLKNIPSPYEGEGQGEVACQVVPADATKLDWMELVDKKSWKFISNLPYSITSFALRQALYNTNPPDKVVVLIQKEVAERAIARDKKTSLLSLMVALASSSAKMIAKVPPSSFYPPPHVDSALLEIIPLSIDERKKKWGIDPEEVMKIAKQGFAHPRKKLASNLGLNAEQAKKVLPDTNIRAEDLSPEAWAVLACHIRKG